MHVKGNHKTPTVHLKSPGWKEGKKGGLYSFVLKLLLADRSHKETERASGKEGGMNGGGRDRKRGAGGGDMIAAAHKEVASR